jgi:ectoine hydroxylase-related dioxygenase (phytanoyl-CoA dioxygenase family)
MPPVAVLEQILILRLHLDEVDTDNGCLRVMPGSHRSGLGEQPDIDPVVCHGTIGTALLMRPLLWHASAKVRDDRPRRVLHLEFAHQDLPGGLDWAERW